MALVLFEGVSSLYHLSVMKLLSMARHCSGRVLGTMCPAPWTVTNCASLNAVRKPATWEGGKGEGKDRERTGKGHGMGRGQNIQRVGARERGDVSECR